MCSGRKGEMTPKTFFISLNNHSWFTYYNGQRSGVLLGRPSPSLLKPNAHDISLTHCNTSRTYPVTPVCAVPTESSIGIYTPCLSNDCSKNSKPRYGGHLSILVGTTTKTQRTRPAPGQSAMLASYSPRAPRSA